MFVNCCMGSCIHAWEVVSMHGQVYMCTHTWQLVQDNLHLQALFVNWMVNWIRASLCDGTIQHASSFWVTGTCKDNMYKADLCLLLISATFWEHFPFFNLVSCSNTSSRVILRSILSRKLILLFCVCWRYTIFRSRWNDSTNMLVFTTVPISKARSPLLQTNTVIGLEVDDCQCKVRVVVLVL